MDITSANSAFILTVTKLQIASVALERYAVDTAWSLEDVETAVAQVGVDGKMSAGWVPRLNAMTISFTPDSESITMFDAIVTAQDTMKTIYTVQGTLSLPSVTKAYTLSNGVITQFKAIPDGGRVLQPQSYRITWESVKPAVL